jgi:hypothetical protein
MAMRGGDGWGARWAGARPLREGTSEAEGRRMTYTESRREEVERVLEVAERQKQLLWLILLLFVFYAALIGMRNEEVLAQSRLLAAAGLLVVGAVSVYFVYKLAVAVGSSVPILYVILVFIPFIALLTLVVLVGKATGFLKQHDIRVGLMGAKNADVDRFREEALAALEAEVEAEEAAEMRVVEPSEEGPPAGA